MRNHRCNLKQSGVCMTLPDLGLCQPERIQIDHGVNPGLLLPLKGIHVEPRTNHSQFLIAETDKDKRMASSLLRETLKQTRQQRCSAPVVDRSCASFRVIEMRAHYDDAVRTPRHHAHYIWIFCMLDHLLSNVGAAAAGSKEQLLQLCLPLIVSERHIFQS